MMRRAETVADAPRLRDSALRDRDAGRLVEALTGAGKALSILDRNFPLSNLSTDANSGSPETTST